MFLYFSDKLQVKSAEYFPTYETDHTLPIRLTLQR
jgi:hypothetical protein